MLFRKAAMTAPARKPVRQAGNAIQAHVTAAAEEKQLIFAMMDAGKLRETHAPSLPAQLLRPVILDLKLAVPAANPAAQEQAVVLQPAELL